MSTATAFNTPKVETKETLVTPVAAPKAPQP